MGAVKAMGTKLKWTSATPSAKYIADLTNIGEIGVESEEIDVTTLDSPNGFKEFIAGLKDAGEISLTGTIKSENNLEDLFNLADAQTVETWEIERVNGAKVAFSAFVKMCKESPAEISGKREFTATLRISGMPVYTKPIASV